MGLREDTMGKLATILGAGHYVPSRVVTNNDLAKLFPTSDEWIFQRTGIRERRYIEKSGIGSSDLALPAAQAAIKNAGRELKDIDAIVFATISPDIAFPGSGCLFAHKIGLSGIPALDVRNQCSGFLYALSVADAWIRAEVYRTVLVIGAEVHSTGMEFTERGRDVTVLFGDGAGAVVVGESPDNKVGIRSIKLHADGSGAQDLYMEAPACRNIPHLTHEMIDDGRIRTRMNGKSVFRWATEKMPEVARTVLADAGWSSEEIDLFIPHQANMRINQMVAAKLRIPEEKTVHNIEHYGNTTAATIPIGISESLLNGRLLPGHRVLMAAFGAGFTWAGATVQF